MKRRHDTDGAGGRPPPPSGGDGEQSQEVSSLERSRPLKRLKRLSKHIEEPPRDVLAKEDDKEEDLMILSDEKEEEEDKEAEGGDGEISDYDENELELDDLRAIQEAEDHREREEEDESDDDEEEDSFVVDDDEDEAADEEDELRSLASVINSKAASGYMASRPKPSAPEPCEEGKKSISSLALGSKKKVFKVQEWRKAMEEKRSKRVVELRKIAEKNPNVKKQLEQAASVRKERYGSKKNHHPLGLMSSLFFHQLVGVSFALLREAIPYKGVYGGIFADDMGVGKTTQMLTLIAFDVLNGFTAFKREQSVEGDQDAMYLPPTLVVCPNTLIRGWIDEARERFETSCLQIVVLNDHYNKDWAHTIPLRVLVEADILLINYEGLRAIHKSLLRELTADILQNPARYNDLSRKGVLLTDLDRVELSKIAPDLARRHFHYGFRTIWRNEEAWTPGHFLYGYHFRRLIFDECTQFKNDTTKTHDSIMALQGQRKWALSGTPIENSMDDLFSLMRVLGVDRFARSIRDKMRWHHFLRVDKSSGGMGAAKGSLQTPAPQIVSKIRKRFLDVLQVRREIQNPNTINPLLSYVKRAADDMSKVWDMFVDARIVAKRERDIHRRRTSFVDDDVPDEMIDTISARYNRALDTLTEERLGEGDHTDFVWRTVTEDFNMPAGFYWYTSQATFKRAYHAVDEMMQEAFGVSIAMLSDGIEMARQVLTDRSIAAPESSEDKSLIKKAIQEHLDTAPDLTLRGPIQIMDGIDLPTPLLFVAHLNTVEQHIYDAVFAENQKEEKEADDEEEDPMEVDEDEKGARERGKKVTSKKRRGNLDVKAFDTITQCVACCADYRTPRNALETLDKGRGALWDAAVSPSVTVDEEASSSEDSVRVQIGGAEAAKPEAKKGAAKKTKVPIEDGEDAEEKNADEDEELLVLDQVPAPRVSSGKADKKKGKTKIYTIPAREGTKFLMFLRYLKAIPTDDKVVVFAHRITFFPRLKAFLGEHGIAAEYITGKFKDAMERDCILKAFKTVSVEDGGPRVLIASLNCMNKGHNLQVANHIIMWIPWWNGAIEEQAKRRIARMGQKKKVYIVYFAFTGTIDELVMSKAGLKEAMIDTVVGTDDGIAKTGANFTRPDTKKTHYMQFGVDKWGAYVIPKNDSWETSMDDLLNLPPDPQFGKTFSHIQENFLLSQNGRLNQVHVAQAITFAAAALARMTEQDMEEELVEQIPLSSLLPKRESSAEMEAPSCLPPDDTKESDAPLFLFQPPLPNLGSRASSSTTSQSYPMTSHSFASRPGLKWKSQLTLSPSDLT